MKSLKEYRLFKDKSQEFMARALDVSLSYYAQIERGVVRAGTGFIYKFKATFPDADINKIFFSDEAMLVREAI